MRGQLPPAIPQRCPRLNQEVPSSTLQRPTPSILHGPGHDRGHLLSRQRVETMRRIGAEEARQPDVLHSRQGRRDPPPPAQGPGDFLANSTRQSSATSFSTSNASAAASSISTAASFSFRAARIRTPEAAISWTSTSSSTRSKRFFSVTFNRTQKHEDAQTTFKVPRLRIDGEEL